MNTQDVKVLVITGFGLNCEKETATAFEYVGAKADKVHLNDLLSGEFKLENYHILAFIGGFSFGDHLGSGTVFSNRIKFNLRDQLLEFIDSGKLIIGICNGFQTITRLGIVPALNDHYFTQSVALQHNDCGTFRDDWVYMKANPRSPCIFTKNMDLFRLPIRHGEGKFVASPEVLAELEQLKLVALRYADSYGIPAETFPENPNGSLNSIAGICDTTGRVFGLMPHPEAFLSPFNAPDWTKAQIDGKLPTEGDGVQIFRNAVNFAKEHLVKQTFESL